jgi:hypothetical protein
MRPYFIEKSYPVLSEVYPQDRKLYIFYKWFRTWNPEHGETAMEWTEIRVDGVRRRRRRWQIEFNRIWKIYEEKQKNRRENGLVYHAVVQLRKDPDALFRTLTRSNPKFVPRHRLLELYLENENTQTRMSTDVSAGIVRYFGLQSAP